MGHLIIIIIIIIIIINHQSSIINRQSSIIIMIIILIIIMIIIVIVRIIIIIIVVIIILIFHANFHYHCRCSYMRVRSLTLGHLPNFPTIHNLFESMCIAFCTANPFHTLFKHVHSAAHVSRIFRVNLSLKFYRFNIRFKWITVLRFWVFTFEFLM